MPGPFGVSKGGLGDPGEVDAVDQGCTTTAVECRELRQVLDCCGTGPGFNRGSAGTVVVQRTRKGR